jgi:hypothetical protein
LSIEVKIQGPCCLRAFAERFRELSAAPSSATALRPNWSAVRTVDASLIVADASTQLVVVTERLLKNNCEPTGI